MTAVPSGDMGRLIQEQATQPVKVNQSMSGATPQSMGASFSIEAEATPDPQNVMAEAEEMTEIVSGDEGLEHLRAHINNLLQKKDSGPISFEGETLHQTLTCIHSVLNYASMGFTSRVWLRLGSLADSLFRDQYREVNGSSIAEDLKVLLNKKIQVKILLVRSSESNMVGQSIQSLMNQYSDNLLDVRFMECSPQEAATVPHFALAKSTVAPESTMVWAEEPHQSHPVGSCVEMDHPSISMVAVGSDDFDDVAQKLLTSCRPDFSSSVPIRDIFDGTGYSASSGATPPSCAM